MHSDCCSVDPHHDGFDSCTCGCGCNCGCICGCGMGGGFTRQFPTRDEKIAALEAYSEQLELELQGVKEKIERLKTKK